MKPTFLDKQVESKSRLNLLFSVPVITVAESYNLNDEEKDFLTNHEELLHTTGGTSYTKDCYVLDHKTQYSFKKYIMKHVRDFAYNILKMNQNIEIYMTNSWVNYNDQYTTHVRHNHSNSLISGVFYIDGSNFFHTRFCRKENLLNWDFNYTENNIFNTDEINVESEKNHMILFPSTCYHAAPTNVNEERRISLSFNTWIRGNIGSDEMCTKLNLK